MKFQRQKSLIILASSILTLLILISFASASIQLTPSDFSGEVEQGGRITFDFTIENTHETYNLTNIQKKITNLVFEEDEDIKIGISVGDVPNKLEIGEESGNIRITINVPKLQSPGEYQGNVEIIGKYNETEVSETIPIEITVLNVYPSVIESCIQTGDPLNNLEIEIRSVNVKEGGIGRRNEWYPFDEVEIEVRVRNLGDEYIEDIFVEWGIYNTQMGFWFAEGDEREFDLRSGGRETLTFNFKLDDMIDIEDADEDNALRDFVIYVWASGYDEDLDFEEICSVAEPESAQIKVERDFVILTDIEHTQTAKCGTELRITANVWNIGTRDQDDVSIHIFNADLGLSESVEIGEIRKFSESILPLEFRFDIPLDVEEKFYQIRYRVIDRNNRIYSADRDAVFYTILDLECEPAPKADVTGILESDAKAGEDLIARLTITNTGERETNYELSVKGYSAWASLSDVSQSSFTLAKGESRDVIITLDVKRDAEGEKTFEADIYSEGKLLKTQTISVIIEPITRLTFARITGGLITRDNWHLWGIGLINLILIIAIIIVAVRVLRK